MIVSVVFFKDFFILKQNNKGVNDTQRERYFQSADSLLIWLQWLSYTTPKQRDRTPSWSPTPVAGAQVLEPSSTVFQGTSAGNCIGCGTVSSPTSTPIWNASLVRHRLTCWPKYWLLVVLFLWHLNYMYLNMRDLGNLELQLFQASWWWQLPAVSAS